ncbi:hypothetical protein BC567DRAFT_239709 [Phyllosticta citribraziliensis]
MGRIAAGPGLHAKGVVVAQRAYDEDDILWKTPDSLPNSASPFANGPPPYRGPGALVEQVACSDSVRATAVEHGPAGRG